MSDPMKCPSDKDKNCDDTCPAFHPGHVFKHIGHYEYDPNQIPPQYREVRNELAKGDWCRDKCIPLGKYEIIERDGEPVEPEV